MSDDRNSTTGMEMSMDKLIERLIELTQGTEEFGIEFNPAREGATKWHVAVGNPTSYLSIGEASANFNAEGATLDEALANMIAILSCPKW